MDKFVEVRKLIASKNPAALKWVPGFVIEWLRNTIHEDEVNDFMELHGNKLPADFCKATIDRFDLKLNASGLENIPDHPQRIILAANHPLGGLDAIAMIYLLRDIRPDIRFIVNDFLLAITTLKDKFIGVNKVGKSAMESLQRVEEQFAVGETTFIFPAGLVSRKINRQIHDLEWKKTFITKAKKYDLPIVPVHIGGRLTDRFYRLANLRKFFGVKFNIEMLYLVDEMFHQQGLTLDIVVGKPILPETFTKEKNDLAWAQWVQDQVYQLKK